MLGDDIESVAAGCPVTTQQAGAVFQGVLVRLLVLGAEFLAPIAAVVAAEVCGQVHVQREGTGGGVDFSKREAGLHQMDAHGISGLGVFRYQSDRRRGRE